MAQIKDMQKPLDTELIIYGRLPLMVSDQCVIKHSAGRCSCQTPAQMADRKEDLYAAELWGLRLMFTTENDRECVEVAKGHLGLSAYKPNVLTRGLYYRGVD